MYASRNRSKAIRRWLPQNRGARDIVRWSDGGRNAGEDRICCGGAPARRGGFAQTRRRSRAERGEDHGVRPRPGRLTELASQVGIAGPGDRAPPLGQTRRVLPGHEAGEAHEGSGLGEATPVEHLGSQTQRADSGHAPVGGQARHLVTEGILGAPRHEIGLARLERGVTQLHRGQVVRVGGRDGGVVEGHGGKSASVTFGPFRPSPPHDTVTNEEPAQPVAGPSEILDHVTACATQVAHSLLGGGGDGDRGELTGSVQPRPSSGVPTVGLDPIARALGDQGGATTSQRTPIEVSRRWRS